MSLGKHQLIFRIFRLKSSHYVSPGCLKQPSPIVATLDFLEPPLFQLSRVFQGGKFSKSVKCLISAFHAFVIVEVVVVGEVVSTKRGTHTSGQDSGGQALFLHEWGRKGHPEQAGLDQFFGKNPAAGRFSTPKENSAASGENLHIHIFTDTFFPIVLKPELQSENTVIFYFKVKFKKNQKQCASCIQNCCVSFHKIPTMCQNHNVLNKTMTQTTDKCLRPYTLEKV